MARTLAIASEEIEPGTITRALLNTASAGNAVIAKIIANSGITISSTGADSGTGDVTLGLGNITPTSSTIGGGTNTATLQVGQATTGIGTVSTTISSTAVTGVGTQFTNTFKQGDSITVGVETHQVSSVTNDTSLAVTANFTHAYSAQPYTLTGGILFRVYGNGNVVIGDNVNNATPTLFINSSGAAGAQEQISFVNGQIAVIADGDTGILLIEPNGNVGLVGGFAFVLTDIAPSISIVHSGVGTALGTGGGFLQIVSGITSGARVTISEFSADTAYPSTVYYKSRGAALLTNAAVSASDVLGQLEFWGSNNNGTSAAARAAYMSVKVDGTNGTTFVPGKIEFWVGTNAAAPVLAATINSSKNLVVVGTVTGSNLSGTNTGDQTISLTGNVTGSGTGSFATTIANGVVTLAMHATLAVNSIMGNNTGSLATPLALTVAQVQTMLSLSGTNSGDATIATFGSSPTANGATISTQAITLQPADATHPGLITSGAQTLGGAKTFAQVIISAGTSSIAPLTFTSGTNLTTATAGTTEYDGAVFYKTPTSNCRGVVTAEQFVQLSSAYTLTSQTAVQKLFNSTSNGTLTLPVGTYDFECVFSLTSMSASSGSFGFAIGGTATIAQAWLADASKSALTTASTGQTTYNTAANTTLVTASATTTGYATIRGNIRVTVAGTIIPQVSLGAAAAAIVGVNSFFRIWPKGSSSVQTVGNWS